MLQQYSRYDAVLAWNMQFYQVYHMYLCDFTAEKESNMTRVTITMRVPPAKRRELLQSLYELIRLMQQEPGCLKAHIVFDMNAQHILTLMEEWQNRQAFERYMQSEYFSILQGAVKLLTTSSEMTITPVTKPSAQKSVHAVLEMGADEFLALQESEAVAP
jgi:quinol monooxygenase YgiN